MTDHAFVDAPAVAFTSPASEPQQGNPAIAVGGVNRAAETITLLYLRDDLVEHVGHHVTSLYVETFWLPILGPSSIWLLRHASHRLPAEGGAYSADAETLARSLGIGAGRSNALDRTLHRLVTFGAAVHDGQSVWRLRSHLAQLSRRQAAQLPEFLRQEHAEYSPP